MVTTQEEEFILALVDNNLLKISELLEKGVSPETSWDSDDTPIEIACQQNNVELAKLLIQYGADIHHITTSCFDRALTNGHIEIIKLLIKSGIRPNLRDLRKKGIDYLERNGLISVRYH